MTLLFFKAFCFMIYTLLDAFEQCVIAFFPQKHKTKYKNTKRQNTVIFIKKPFNAHDIKQY